jgi:1,4-alpha-glucan branching enzyme
MICKQFVEKNGSLVARVTFSLPSSIWADTICLVGEFNGWNPESHPFQRAEDGSWVLTMEFECGRRYEFRYLCDRREWMNDNQADAYVANRFAGSNCVLITDPPPEE